MSAVMIATTAAVISASAATHSSGCHSEPVPPHALALMFLFVVWLILWMVCWLNRDEYNDYRYGRRWQWYPMTAIHWLSTVALALGVIAGIAVSINCLIN